jgi:hypothetical protein
MPMAANPHTVATSTRPKRMAILFLVQKDTTGKAVSDQRSAPGGAFSALFS